jgi:glutamate decarboxylase
MASDPNYFVTFPNRERHEKFFRDAFEIILKGAVFEGIERSQPVLRFELPETLKSTMDLTLGQKSIGTHEELLTFIQQVIHHSVKTGHPYFVNQLYSGYGNFDSISMWILNEVSTTYLRRNTGSLGRNRLDPFGLAADWATSALNASVYTYEVAPVFTLMELEVFEKMRNIVGFPVGKGDGLFCPGGRFQMAMLFHSHGSENDQKSRLA